MDILAKITIEIPPGTVLKTPSGRSQFIFYQVDPEKILLLLGKNRTNFKIPSSLFDGLFDFLNGKSWIRIGALHGKASKGTLDEYAQNYTSGTSAASYVASLLEKAGIVEICRDRPARIRLK